MLCNVHISMQCLILTFKKHNFEMRHKFFMFMGKGEKDKESFEIITASRHVNCADT